MENVKISDVLTEDELLIALELTELSLESRKQILDFLKGLSED